MLDNILIYNPKCSKSRKAVELVDGKGISVEKRNYLEKPLTIDELKSVVNTLGCSITDIVRVKETAYTEMNLANASEDTVYEAVAKEPILLERPIAILGGKAVVARPPEKLEEIL